MSGDTTSRFGTLLDSLSADEFVSLVAEIWTARGWETTVRENIVVATRPNRSEPRRIGVSCRIRDSTPGTFRDLDIDVLVTRSEIRNVQAVAGGRDVRVLGPPDLCSMLLYAVERERAISLVRRYFDRELDETGIVRGRTNDMERSDRPPTAEGFPDTTSEGTGEEPIERVDGGRDTAPTHGQDEVNHTPDRASGDSSRCESARNDDRSGSDVRRASPRGRIPDSSVDNWIWGLRVPVFGIGGLLTVLFLILAISPVWIGVTGGSGITGIDAIDLWGSQESETGPPPGVDEDGIYDVTALAGAHEITVMGQSYQLRIRHDGSRGRIVTHHRWESGRQVVRVGESGSYRYIVKGTRQPTSIEGQAKRVSFEEFAEDGDVDPKGYEPADREYFLTVKDWDSRVSKKWAGKQTNFTYDTASRNPDVFTVNGKSAPRTLHPEDGSPLIVEQGDTVRVHFVNAGYMSHPLHIHNHRFQRIEKDGGTIPEAARYDMDVTNVAPAERHTIEFTADADPGIYLMHCHKVNHVMNGSFYPGGMLTGVVYKSVMDTDIFDQLLEHAGYTG